KGRLMAAAMANSNSCAYTPLGSRFSIRLRQPVVNPKRMPASTKPKPMPTKNSKLWRMDTNQNRKPVKAIRPAIRPLRLLVILFLKQLLEFGFNLFAARGGVFHGQGFWVLCPFGQRGGVKAHVFKFSDF